jgi:nucleoside-diphosphate-sugar epimerase
VSRTCVVTGAAGFIGSRLCALLLDAGWTVRGLDRLTDFTPVAEKRRRIAALSARGPFAFARVDLARGDVRDALRGADVVFHLAGQAGVRDSFGAGALAHVERNVRATTRLAEAMARRGGGRLVVASSSSVYGDAAGRPLREDRAPRPGSPYAVTKLAAEGVARSLVPDAVILRYFTVYGPGQRPDMAFHRFAEAALRRLPAPLHGDGSQVRDFTYVDDVVSATIAAAERGSGVINVGGGSPASLNEALAHIGEIVGIPVPVVPSPPARGHVASTWADTSRAREALGWTPVVGLREGLERQVAALRDAVPSPIAV